MDCTYPPLHPIPKLKLTQNQPTSYRIESFGIKLLPPKSWHKTFTLSRLPNQPPLSAALAYPMSDQLDDWRDYQRLKHLDRGEDFALLREILRDPTPETNNHDLNGEGDRERHDSGYFSRRNSKLSSRVNSISEAAVEDEDEMGEQRGNSVSSSMLEDIAETELTLVAEGTPSTLDSPPRTARPALSTLDGDHSQSFSDPDPDTEFDCSASSTDDEAWTSTPRLRKTATVILISSPKATDGNARPGKEGEISGAESRADWVEEGGIWMSSNGGLEGVEDREFCDWVTRTQDAEEDLSDHPDSVSEASSTDDEAWTTTPRLRKTDTVVHIPALRAEEGNRGPGMVGEVTGDGCQVGDGGRAEWVEEWGMWRGEDGGLEGVEEREFIDCVGRQGGRKESEGEGVAPEDTVGVGSGRT